MNRASGLGGPLRAEYAHWIGLYLSFNVNWVLGPFIHGRLQNLKTNEDTFSHDRTPLNLISK